MKRLLLLVITMLCPLAIARGQYVYYGDSRAQAQAAYARAQRAQADAYAYQRAQAESYRRWQAETYQRAQAYQRAWAGYQREQAAAYARTQAYQRAWAGYQREQAAAYARAQAYQRAWAGYQQQRAAGYAQAQAYQRARAEAYMRSQAQGGPATQPQRQAGLGPALMWGGRAVVGAGRAVREYLRTPEGRREAAESGIDALNAAREIRERQDMTRPRDRQLERAAVRSVPSESSGLRSQLGEQPRIERRDLLDRFPAFGSKGLNDRIGSGQKETKGRQDRSRPDSSKSGNTPARSKDIQDWQPRG